MCGDAASFASLAQRSTNACAAHVAHVRADVLEPGGPPAAARARHGRRRQRQHLRRRARLREDVVEPREGRPTTGARTARAAGHQVLGITKSLHSRRRGSAVVRGSHEVDAPPISAAVARRGPDFLYGAFSARAGSGGRLALRVRPRSLGDMPSQPRRVQLCRSRGRTRSAMPAVSMNVSIQRMAQLVARACPHLRERNSTSKIRLRRDGGTHHYNFPLSAREHNSKHVASPARKRKPPAPACLFRPPRGGGTRPSTSARGATAQLARRWGSPTSCY